MIGIASQLAALAALLAVARVGPPPVRVVPMDDAPLAATVLLGAGRHAPVLLFDPSDTEGLRRALARHGRRAECLVRSSTPAGVRARLEETIDARCTTVGDFVELARMLWPAATSAVLVPQSDYPALLRGAALAGTLDAALVPVSSSARAISAALAGWPLEAAYLSPELTAPSDVAVPITRLKSVNAVARLAVRRLPAPPRLLVVANPGDREGVFSPAALSLLAPLIARAHDAPLVLVDDSAPDAVEATVQAFIDTHRLAPTHLYLVGDERALRSHVVPDPVLANGGPEALGGAREVRVELFSEIQRGAPQDYAVGRFVAEDAARGSAILASQLHRRLNGSGRVVVLSNADEEFELGETIARTTVSELRNAGVAVRAEYRDRVTPARIADALKGAGMLVWEGHARDLTLTDTGAVAVERTPPLVVLQGCYTLERSDPFILFERGTQAIVATSAAIYSASGSSFARALMDRLLHGATDLGTAVRDARNYLLAVTELKKRRGHSDWTKTYRAALAFALWGDPTARPPLTVKAPSAPPATWQVADGALELSVPRRRLPRAQVGRYHVRPVSRAMLSGLILRDGDDPQRQVKELFYDVLPAPETVTAACPAAEGWDVVSLHAPRTGTLSVLARPPGVDPDAGTPAGTYRFPLAADPAACPAPESEDDAP